MIHAAFNLTDESHEDTFMCPNNDTESMGASIKLNGLEVTPAGTKLCSTQLQKAMKQLRWMSFVTRCYAQKLLHEGRLWHPQTHTQTVRARSTNGTSYTSNPLTTYAHIHCADRPAGHDRVAFSWCTAEQYLGVTVNSPTLPQSSFQTLYRWTRPTEGIEDEISIK